jgi:hypothetical protein
MIIKYDAIWFKCDTLPELEEQYYNLFGHPLPQYTIKYILNDKNFYGKRYSYNKLNKHTIFI